MKRHAVMDLFFDHLKDPVDGDWNEGSMPNADKCKLLVKTKDGSEKYAYFYSDGGCCNLTPHHYFWCCETKEPIEDVKAWKFLKEEDML